MAQTSDERGFPNLERHDETHRIPFDTRSQSFFIYNHQEVVLDPNDPRAHGEVPRQRAHRAADLPFTLYMIDRLVRLHQMEWTASAKNQWLLYFPHMFMTPEPGWQIRNQTTRETYTVKSIGTDANKHFTGAVLLEDGLKAPGLGTDEEPGAWDRLEWIEPDNKEIRFFRSFPERDNFTKMVAPDAADEATLTDLSFSPTITTLLVRKEPGTIGKREFDPAKMPKSRILAYEPDPFDPKRYSLEIRYQWFESVVQFDCWSPLQAEADRLADWFETFVNLYTWVLKLNGVAEIRFWQLEGDPSLKGLREFMPHRSLQYYVKTMSVIPTRVRNLGRLHIRARLQHRPGAVLSPGEDTGGGLFLTQWDRFHDDSGNWLGGTIGVDDTRGFADSFLNP